MEDCPLEAEVAEWYPKASEMLYVLPGVSKFLRNDPNIISVLGHRSVVEFIEAIDDGHANCGWLLHRLNEPEKLRANPSATSEKKCCFHVPTLKSKEMFGFKFVHSLDGPNALSLVSEDMKTQLKTVEKILSSLKSCTYEFMEETIRIVFFVFITGKKVGGTNSNRRTKSDIEKLDLELLAKKDEPQNFFNNLLNDIMPEAKSFNCVEVELIFVRKTKSTDVFNSSQNGQLRRRLEMYRKRKTSYINPFLWALVKAAPKIRFLEIKDDEFCFKQHPTKSIRLNSQGMREFSQKYFKMWDKGIITIPNFDRIKSGLVYHTDENLGQLHQSSSNEYIGEMQNFWIEFISLLDSPVGLLMKKYTNSLLSKVLKHPYNEPFEFDWLYCSTNQIVVFEIGRTANTEDPTTTVQNKIEQLFKKLIPRIQFLVWSLLRQIGQNIDLTDEQFDYKCEQFIRDFVRVVLFFPNINVDKLKSVLPKARETANLSRVSELAWTQAYILVEALSVSKKTPSLLKLNATDIVQKSKETLFSMFSQSKENANVSTTAELTSIASILALGYFLDEDGTIDEFSATPLSLDEKFLDEQKKFMKNRTYKTGRARQTRLEQLNITLSPQQHRIWEEDKKLVLLAGEPGAGKTVMLLAKAFKSSLDPKISSILFYAPETKTALRNDVSRFVEYPEYREQFLQKFKFVSRDELYALKDRSFADLHRTVLLIDEIYFEYNESGVGNESRSQFFRLSVEIFPHLRNCWMTNIVATRQSDSFQTLAKFFAVEMFHVQPLTVQYRSSSHIGVFSTNYLHGFKELATSSVRTPGCFMSSEIEISIQTYRLSSDIDLSVFDSKLNDKRWAIVFSHSSKQQEWRNQLESAKKFSQIFICSSSSNCGTCEFSGGEADSIVVVVDDFVEGTEDEIYPVYNLAITRAQSRLSIYVRQEIQTHLQNFLDKRLLSLEEKILLDARANVPGLDLRGIRPQKMPGIVEKLYGIAISNEDSNLLQKIRDRLGGSTPHVTTVLNNLRGEKTPRFLKDVHQLYGTKIKNCLTDKENALDTAGARSTTALRERSAGMETIMDIVLHAIDISCKALLEWIFKLMGEEIMKKAIAREPRILLHACFKVEREILKFCITKLRRIGLWEREVAEIYHIWGNQTTILTLLVHNDCEAKPLALFLEEEFPGNLISHTFFGKNVLQYAIEHNNIAAIALLKEKGILYILIHKNISYEGKTASEYARQLGFSTIAEILE